MKKPFGKKTHRRSRAIEEEKSRIEIRESEVTEEVKALPRYFSIPLYICFCLVTAGVFPYVYLYRNAPALTNFSGRIVPRRVRLFAATGLAVQFLAIAGILFFLLGTAVEDTPQSGGAASFIYAYLLLFVVIVLPLRCFHHFNIAAALRHEVILWDESQIMIDRTANSWIFLFLGGSVYLQHHINRLAGLGMPTLRDEATAAEAPPIKEPIRNHVDSTEAGKKR